MLGWHGVNHAWLGREVALSVSEAVKKLLLTHPSQTRIFHTFTSKWGHKSGEVVKLNIGIGHNRGEVLKLNIPERDVVKRERW